MNELIALRVNCPLCGKSLMDPKTLVDNIPGVKLNISFDDNKGTIHLSSIYGSFNYTTNLKIPMGKEVTFSCPHCEKEITSDQKCVECSAHMVPLKIENDGIVRICSRAGCKKHSVEFEDISQALEYFYHSFDIGEQGLMPENIENSNKLPEVTIKDKETIKSGTFLRTYCPHCDDSLVEGNSVKFKVVAQKGEGILKLSPFLNVFTNASSIYIPEGEAVKDLRCPQCNHTLIQKNKTCPECEAKIVAIQVAANSKLIDFYFCSKKGCRWHGLSDEDINDIILEASSEW